MQSNNFRRSIMFFAIGIIQIVFSILIWQSFKANLLPLLISNGFNIISITLITFIAIGILTPFVAFLVSLTKTGNINRKIPKIKMVWLTSIFITSIFSLGMITKTMDSAEKTLTIDLETKSNVLVINTEKTPITNAEYSLELSNNLGVIRHPLGLYYSGVSFETKKSTTNKAYLEKKITSRGKNKMEARASIRAAINHFMINENKISFSDKILIPNGNEFNYQKVKYTLYVPEGMEVDII
jgi:hypothetical protein